MNLECKMCKGYAVDILRMDDKAVKNACAGCDYKRDYIANHKGEFNG